ncbi:Ankyrin repeat family protein [Melia azedarach]|uniref:Ankyrin repeat family protein n=1 Tax=Melia azedarach TaxID=155640 RepID=A0ACC1Y2T5_MELAZ|nr:Ankyrin repeat family protein [Melia azedarach]
MESMLYEAALKGSVHTLLEWQQKDRFILDKVGKDLLSEGPLHVAALLGHVDFVREILRQKPELAGELDSQRSSALHKASHKGYVDVVQALLQVNPEMCFARNADGRNPLHLAAMTGRIDVLEELVRATPLAASATTIWGDNILHLCVQHNQFQALKFLLENMDDQELLNAKNDFGMTTFHLAVADKQIEAIKFLTTRTTLKVNALNANGITALDILTQSKRDPKDSEIRELLRRAGAIRAKDIQLSVDELCITESNSLTSHGFYNQKQKDKGIETVHNKEDNWLEKKRNTLMVVASLIATINCVPNSKPIQGFKCVADGDDNHENGGTPEPVSNIEGDEDETNEVREGNIVVEAEPVTRDAVEPRSAEPALGRGFLASLSIILLLISGLPLKRRLFVWIFMVTMWIATTAVAFTYTVSVGFLADPYSDAAEWYSTSSMTNNSMTSHENNQKQQGKRSENVHKKEDNWLEKMRNALMVVASLIATMAFQAALPVILSKTLANA